LNQGSNRGLLTHRPGGLVLVRVGVLVKTQIGLGILAGPQRRSLFQHALGRPGTVLGRVEFARHRGGAGGPHVGRLWCVHRLPGVALGGRSGGSRRERLPAAPGPQSLRTSPRLRPQQVEVATEGSRREQCREDRRHSQQGPDEQQQSHRTQSHHDPSAPQRCGCGCPLPDLLFARPLPVAVLGRADERVDTQVEVLVDGGVHRCGVDPARPAARHGRHVVGPVAAHGH